MRLRVCIQTKYELFVSCAGEGEVKQYIKEVTASSHMRRNLEDLSKGDAESLKQALGHMMEDGSFEHIARSVSQRRSESLPVNQSVNQSLAWSLV